MRHYETVFIMVPDLPDEEREGIVERYHKVLTDSGSDMLVVDDWGRRRLAYEIKNFTKGHYVLFEHASEPSIIAELERQMRLDDQILRYLTVKIEDTFDKAAYEAEKAQKAPSKPADEPEDESEDSTPEDEDREKPSEEADGESDEKGEDNEDEEAE